MLRNEDDSKAFGGIERARGYISIVSGSSRWHRSIQEAQERLSNLTGSKTAIGSNREGVFCGVTGKKYFDCACQRCKASKLSPG